MNQPAADIDSRSGPAAWKVNLVAAVLLAFAVALFFQIWSMGRPITLPDASNDKLECASYTPSHNGRMLGAVERKAWIENDLKLLAQRFRCVRTYSVSEGLDDVPRVARELGLSVMLGLWISMDAPSNDREIARGIELANEYSDIVRGVIVGNEVLLRRELAAAQLRTYIERVRAATNVPVTYADVWEFWLRNEELAKVVDLVTVHILPYWEDDPIDIDRALDHVQIIYKKVQDAFPGKVVLIGETGWPSQGRPRLNAVPGVVNEARFIREFVAYADLHKVPYNLIEAFDQPWKRNQEGTVGGYWGLFTAAGAPKFEFSGPVVADSNWRIYAFMSLAGAFVFGGVAWCFGPRPSVRATAALAIAGHAAGSVVALQWLYLSTANLRNIDWTATLAWSFFGWCNVVIIVSSLAKWVDGATPTSPLGMAELIRGIGYGVKKPDRLVRLLGVTRFLTLLGVAYVSLGLAYDGRGRDFPVALWAFPILAFALLEFVSSGSPKRLVDREESTLAFVLFASSVFVAYQETYLNARAMIWCGLCLAFAVTIAVGQWRSLNPNQRSQQNSDSAQLESV